MELYANHPYWLMKNGIINAFSSLDKDISVDIAVIGAGISGALTSYYLRNTGHSLAVFDRRHVGMGSTAASTAFLQYEIDTPLAELCHYTGEKNAVQSYRLCRKAIYDIADICGDLDPAFDFHLRPSLQYASFKTHRERLFNECQLRRKHGFDVEWLEAEHIQKDFGFEAPGAIFSADGGEVDAYLLANSLIKAVLREGHGVFTNTMIRDITHNKRGITLSTGDGYKVRARKLIIACGYESLKYIQKKIADIHSTYALVSEPVPEAHLWHKNSLVWETATPYLYFRIVSGNRVMMGGKDDPYHKFRTPASKIKQKTSQLLHSFAQKMQHIPLKADFSWEGAFAVTKDGLPYIGSIPGINNTYFALGYGGNGITFSVIAAAIIRDSILNKKNEAAQIFGFNR